MKFWKTDLIAALVAKVFAPRPNETIWQFAERVVFFDATMAPEPGPYRSVKTPWTRRVQELIKHPVHNGHRIKKIVLMKSSQTGFTEAILNAIRYFAKYAPRNVIYAIDSRDEAGNISDRLTPSLKALGEEIFTGDEDDEKRFALTLRHMKIFFFGSFSAGRFANKQAPFCVCDEYEEHGRIAGDTTSLANLESRMKRSAEGLVVVISKPKLENGPIHREFLKGNQEINLVPCPHCGTFQEITFKSLQYSHCKNLLGEWDKEKVLRETHMRCASFDPRNEKNCPPIREDQRPAMVAQGKWYATAKGDPQIISQYISDLYDPETPYIWGQIALEVINAEGNPAEKMGIWNHRLGLPWRQSAVARDKAAILALREKYTRGTIPFPAWLEVPNDEETEKGKPPALIVPLVLGSDVGIDYVRWTVTAISKDNTHALIDWGTELHPDAIREMIFRVDWPEYADPLKRWRVMQGGMDANYRREDVYPACLESAQILWPVSGGGSSRGRASFAFGTLPTFPQKWFGLLSFNDRDFKSELYIDRIPNKRLWVPADIDKRREGETFDIIAELCAERLEEDRNGNFEWTTREPGKTTAKPNHSGDCLKICCLIWRYMNRKRDPYYNDPPPQPQD